MIKRLGYGAAVGLWVISCEGLRDERTGHSSVSGVSGVALSVK